jgi:hypothetical protein
MEHAKLIVHAGGVRVTREQLAVFETPAATATWKPLPHHVLVDAIHEEVRNRKIEVVKEEYAVQRRNNMLVGTLVLNWLDNDEFAAALAFRHANDMSEAVKLYAGVRVFACDNTAVSGDEIILRKKHTKNFDIRAELPEAFDRYRDGTLVLTRGINELKNCLCSELYGKEVIYDIFHRKIVPLRLFHPIVESWHMQLTDDRLVCNEWMLYNCFTEHLKKLTPNAAMRANVRLGKFFKLGRREVIHG